MTKDESQQYVDWPGLRYYDSRIKEHVSQNYASADEAKQLRNDIEQAETRLETFEKSTQTTVEHILTHIEELDETATTLISSVEKLQDDLKSVNGGTLPSDVATKDFVLEEIEKAKLSSETPSENYVTEEELAAKNYITADDIPHIPTKISELNNDVGYLTEHQSLEGLATEKFVTDKIAEISDIDLENYVTKDELPDTSAFLTAIPDEYITESELESHGFLTSDAIANMATSTQIEEIQTRVTSFENNVTNNYMKIEDGVTKDDLDSTVADVVSSQVESIIDDKIEEVLTDGATVSSIVYDEF